MISLYIDTTSRKQIVIKLKHGNKEKIIKKKLVKSSQAVLPLIEKMLTADKLEIKNLDEVWINAGPGSYTGIRVGLSIANSLSYY